MWLTRAVVAAILALTTVVATPSGPAQASYSTICKGYDSCNLAGYPHSGYKEASGNAYWRMVTGHNCTNYVAYRMVQNGMPNSRPWSGDGNAYNWGRLNPNITNGTPALGSVAWWNANASPAGSTGHVAYVERIVSDSEIWVSEDNYGGDFYWRKVTKAGGGWPSGFIHFKDVPSGQPFGSFDTISSPANGRLNVRGWTADPDSLGQPTAVHVYVGGPAGSGAAGYAFTANRSRPDVAAAVSGAGPNHGFDETIDVGRAGTFPVYVYAINLGGTRGDNVLLGSKAVTVGNPVPVGQFDTLSSPSAGQITVRGWAFDPDVKTAPVGIHVYVGGPAGTPGAEGHAVGIANRSRPDVGKAYPGVGDNHGYDVTITTGRTGNQPVYVYALNSAGTSGNNVLLGSKSVAIADPATLGNFEASAAPTPGVIKVVGWTLDPNTRTQPNNVDVYVGGPAGTPGAEVHRIVANSPRPDVAQAFPAAGDRHGFNASFRTAKRGRQPVYVYAINAPGTPGANLLLGNRPVVVAEYTPSTVKARLVRSTVKKNRAPKVKVTVRAAKRVPTGTVAVYVGKRKVKTAFLTASAKGKITVTLPKQKAGRYKVKVVYSGDTYISGRTSSRVNLKVRRG